MSDTDRPHEIPSHYSAKPAISVAGLSKTYEGGHNALTDINLDIRKGEIFALLGPNGAGKTTLISIICEIVNPTEGSVSGAGANGRITRSGIASRQR